MIKSVWFFFHCLIFPSFFPSVSFGNCNLARHDQIKAIYSIFFFFLKLAIFQRWLIRILNCILCWIKHNNCGIIFISKFFIKRHLSFFVIFRLQEFLCNLGFQSWSVVYSLDSIDVNALAGDSVDITENVYGLKTESEELRPFSCSEDVKHPGNEQNINCFRNCQELDFYNIVSNRVDD